MHQLMEKIPKFAQDTQKQVSLALQHARTGTPQQKFNPSKLAELLQSKYNEDLIEAIKMLFSSYLQNKDIYVYLSRIIALLPRDDLDLKRLCQILITEIAAQPKSTDLTQTEIIFVSISTIYKDIVSFQTAIKLYALKTLPQLRVVEIQPILLSSLKQIVVDKNPLVRRVAATTIIKLKDLTNDLTLDEYSDAIEFLLKDTPFVRIAAVNTMIQMNDDPNLVFMHERFYNLVKDLVSLSHFDMETSVRYLHHYAILYLSHCKNELKDEKGNISSDAKDLNILLDGIDKLVRLPYPAVIVAIANLYLDFPSQSRIKKITRTLIRFLNISSESKYIVLLVMYRIAQLYPLIVKEYFRSFTIIQIEKLYCKIKKLEIVQLLIDDNNFPIILEELLHHTRSSQSPLAAAAVRLLGKTSQKHPKFLKRTVRSLVDVLRWGSIETKNYVVEAFCNIMNEQSSPQLLPLLTLCLQFLDEVTDISFKCSVIKLLVREHQMIPTIAADNLRKLILTFQNHHENIKYEIITLGYFLNKLFNEKGLDNHEIVSLYYKHLLTLGEYDQSLLVRDLARSLLAGMSVDQIQNEQEIITNLVGAQTEVISSSSDNPILIGSLSDIIGYQLPGYKNLSTLPQQQSQTHELRKVKVEVPVIKQQQQQQEIITKPMVPIVQQQENPKKKKKEIEEEVKKHYSNLDQVLNDFFVDE